MNISGTIHNEFRNEYRQISLYFCNKKYLISRWKEFRFILFHEKFKRRFERFLDNSELDFEYPSVPHRPPQFNTKNPSVPHQKTLSSTQPPQFHTKKPSVPPPSVPHQKPLSSTQKSSI